MLTRFRVSLMAYVDCHGRRYFSVIMNGDVAYEAVQTGFRFIACGLPKSVAADVRTAALKLILLFRWRLCCRVRPLNIRTGEHNGFCFSSDFVSGIACHGVILYVGLCNYAFYHIAAKGLRALLSAGAVEVPFPVTVIMPFPFIPAAGKGCAGDAFLSVPCGMWRCASTAAVWRAGKRCVPYGYRYFGLRRLLCRRGCFAGGRNRETGSTGRVSMKEMCFDSYI